MKKRNLFLSLICSIILTVALATFTIVSVVSPKKSTGGNDQVGTPVGDTTPVDPTPENPTPVDVNADRDGSAEKPYIIYDAASFNKYVGSYGNIEVKPVMVPVMVDEVDEEGNVVTDEEGNTIKVEKVILVEQKDENGNVIKDENGNPLMIEEIEMTEQLDDEGNIVYNDTCYFELSGDIDFAGTEFVTLFNQDKAFNGHLNGKGFALKNISINVANNNIEKFIYKRETNNGLRYDLNLGVFGKVDGAEIIDIKLDNISVKINEEVYTDVIEGDFFTEISNDAMNVVRVGTLAGVAKNSTIKAEVSGSVYADAYTITLNNAPENNAVVGGLAGLVQNSTITESKVNVKITNPEVELNQINYVGGLAGLVYTSNVEKSEVKAEISTTHSRETYVRVGGAFGYMVDTNIADSNINLIVSETKSRKDFKGLGNYGFDYEGVTWIAGISSVIAVNDSTVSIANVNIETSVTFDGVYAGAVVAISEDSDTTKVSFKNVIINSDVNVAEAFGFARSIGNATVEYDEDAYNVDTASNMAYNVKLVGKVILNNTQDKDGISNSAFERQFILNKKADNFKIVVSESIGKKLAISEKRVVDEI